MVNYLGYVEDIFLLRAITILRRVFWKFPHLLIPQSTRRTNRGASAGSHLSRFARDLISFSGV